METPAKEFDILLVEDNPADAELTMETLRSCEWPIRFHHVCDGVEAMNFLHKQPPFQEATRPTLILLDLNMPRKGGREVLAEMKADEKLRSIPVLVFTTSEDEKDVLGAYRLNANGYISKPIDLEKFSNVLRVMENFWLNIVKLPPLA